MKRIVDFIDDTLAPYPRLHTPLKAAWNEVWWTRDRIGGYIGGVWLYRYISDVIKSSAATGKKVKHGAKRLRAGAPDDDAPIIIFNASSGPSRPTFNEWVGLLTSWGLQMGGRRVIRWVCNEGMLLCPPLTAYSAIDGKPMPCKLCVRIRKGIFKHSTVEYLKYDRDLSEELGLDREPLTLEQLMDTCYRGYEIGRLCLPSLRRGLRQYSLGQDEVTLRIYKDFVLSGANIVDEFTGLIERTRPEALVVFNGTFYPEAIAREVALRHNVRTISYEVGFRARSAFFSHDVATKVAIKVPRDFIMKEQEEQELKEYLGHRFQGDFTMGGVRFWRDIQGMGEEIASRIGEYRRVVSVFTNVSFDTSQTWANTIFSDMFDWLGETLKLAADRPDTLFIVRGHPAEITNRSREPIADWMEESGLLSRKNILFIPPHHYVNSYELVGVSNLSVVYNSTIGLESVMLGTPVVCGGQSKYSSTSFVNTFANKEEYLQHLAGLLSEDRIEFAQEWREEAYRFFYYLFFKASLDMSKFLEPVESDGKEIFLKPCPLGEEEFSPENSEEMRIIFDGIVNGKDFCYD